MALTERAIKNLIQNTVKEAVHAELGAYKVPKEQHYQDHVWIKALRDWQDRTSSTFWRTVISTITGGLILILLYGFIFFGKKYLSE